MHVKGRDITQFQLLACFIIFCLCMKFSKRVDIEMASFERLLNYTHLGSNRPNQELQPVSQSDYHELVHVACYIVMAIFKPYREHMLCEAINFYLKSYEAKRFQAPSIFLTTQFKMWPKFQKISNFLMRIVFFSKIIIWDHFFLATFLGCLVLSRCMHLL